jgi:UDP-galactopyranose mutase
MARGFDYLIVGAGYAGGVLAERLAAARKERVLPDKRPHLAGNAFDSGDDGVLVPHHSPHIFHSNSKRVFEHLSRFTARRLYRRRVRALVDGQGALLPINLGTVNQLYGLNPSSFEEDFSAEGDPHHPVPRPENRRLADARCEVTFVGRLANVQDYNTDQAQALEVFETLPDV